MAGTGAGVGGVMGVPGWGGVDGPGSRTGSSCLERIAERTSEGPSGIDFPGVSFAFTFSILASISTSSRLDKLEYNVHFTTVTTHLRSSLIISSCL
jgi:hypothetical protein